MQKVVLVLKNYFVSPFSSDIYKNQLYNIASGTPVTSEINDCLLTVFERGTDKMADFGEVLQKHI